MLLLDAAAASHFGDEALQGAEDLLLNVCLLRLLLLQADLLLHQHLHRQTQAAHLRAERLDLILQSTSSGNLLDCLLGARVPLASRGWLAARGLQADGDDPGGGGS